MVEGERPPNRSKPHYSRHPCRKHKTLDSEVPIVSDPTLKKYQPTQHDARDTHSAPLDSLPASGAPRSESRRKFLGNVRGVALAAATAGAIGFEPLLGSKRSLAQADNDRGESKGDERAEEDADIRIDAAKAERRVPIPPHATNGDEERYADKCGTYTKAILQDAPGRVNLR